MYRLLLLGIVACGTSHEAPADAPAAPVVAAPVTPAAVTPAPVTPAPVTPAPVTPAPVTPAPVTPDPVTEAAATGPDTWAAGVVDVPMATGGGAAQVAAIRSASHAGFDRIVVEFKGDRAPGYRLAYADGPARDCTAGAPVALEGAALLLVQLSPASAHDEAGASTIEKEAKPALGNVREIERTCDFEGVVAFVVGVGAPNPFRAFTLTAPPRLVVDIKQ